jgi:hypothetical protein
MKNQINLNIDKLKARYDSNLITGQDDFDVLEFKTYDLDPDDLLYWCECSLGRITVVDRLTGFGFGWRDVETGFRDTDNNFWLASGKFDIRLESHFRKMTISEAIQMIKDNANTCIPEFK